MPRVRYQPLGPLLAGEGSRAFLGLEVTGVGDATPVVMIWLPNELSADPGVIERVRRETARAAVFEHPNIIRVRSFEKLDDGFARIVEYADGESLRRVLQAAPQLPERIAAKLVCDAALGVHYAHLAGNDDGTPFVHGDIRPETIMVTYSGIAKVAGYGALAFAPKEAGGKRVQGRRTHAAPEQIIGGRDAYSVQTDVYLLGLTLYECICGAVPFLEHGKAFDYAVVTYPVPPPKPGWMSPELEKVIARACAKKAAERFPTPMALKDAIEGALGSLPSQEEVARCLENILPPGDPARRARQAALEAGQADLQRRKQSARTAALESAAPRRPPSPSVRETTSTTVTLASAESITARERSDRLMRAVVLTVAGIAAAVALLSAWLLTTHSAVPPSVARALAAGRTPTAPVFDPVPLEPPVPVQLPSPAPAAATTALPTPSPEPVLGERELPSMDVVALGPTATRPPARGGGRPSPEVSAPNETLESTDARSTGSMLLYADPEVDVSLGGKTLGRTPVTLKLPPGRHLLYLNNRELAIGATRMVEVKAGDTKELYLTLETGTILVDAPQGSSVFLDGRVIGSAPVDPFTAYEGNHVITVVLGEARWSKRFELSPRGQASFDVHLEH